MDGWLLYFSRVSLIFNTRACIAIIMQSNPNTITVTSVPQLAEENISMLASADISAIEIVECSSTRWPAIFEALLHFTSLRHLEVSNCKLEKLSGLENLLNLE